MTQRSQLDQRCVDTIRTLSIDAVQKANSGHPGAAMGMAPAMFVLWDRFLRHDPARPDLPNRDRFVLSMGHASALLYSTMHLTGYNVSLDDLRSFRQLGSNCAGHPESTLLPGVETTTGPLGQGAGNSVGMAIAQRWLTARLDRSDHVIADYTVYAMCGDGDMMEGVSSEAASMAGHLGLSNLVWLYDSNQISIDGSTNIAFTENVGARFIAYGWLVLSVKDGNNLDEIHAALEAARSEADRPTLIIVQTQIGYGSPNRAGKAKAHGEPLGEDEVRLTKASYGWNPDEHFHVPGEVAAHMTEGAKRRGRALSEQWQAAFDAYANAHPDLAEQWREMQDGHLPKDWDADLPVFKPDPKGIATRVAGAKALNAVAARVPWIVGGSADLACSTKTIISGSDVFQRDTPAGCNIAFGVREHAMGAIMNGLALSKLRPFGSSFLTFTDYCRPAIRLAALCELPCVFIFTHDSICLGEDGPTHQPIEHLASLRAMPNLDVIRPCDANEVSVAWKYIMSLGDRPTLLALSRQNLPILDRTRFAPADELLHGAYVLLDCDGTPDVILIGTGSEVHLCIDAADLLRAEGLSVRIVSMPCWELFDRQPIDYVESVLPPGVEARVSVEAGATMGWSKYVGTRGTSIGVDRFGTSAPAADAMRAVGLTVERVVETARRVASDNASVGESVNRHSPKGSSDRPSEAVKATGHAKTRIEQIFALGQSIWCDSISRHMIDSGELSSLIESGIVGMTSNPSIFQQAISNSHDYDEVIQRMVADGKNADEIYETLTVRDVADAADLLRPVYDRTDGVDGLVSLEVNPHLSDDTDGTIAEAKHLFQAIGRPNVFIKVPATLAGMPAIEALIAEGINVNVTLIFSLAMYDKVTEAYIRGLEHRANRGKAVSKVVSVASFFVSRVDTMTDKLLTAKIDAGANDLTPLLGKAAIGNAKLAYERFTEIFHEQRFSAMAKQGARVQRPLWASTSTKNPNFPDTYYVDTLIGDETVNTLPLKTIAAALDHATIARTVSNDLDTYRTAIERIEAAGISMDKVTNDLLEAGVQAFVNSFDQLMADIRTKMSTLQAV